MGYLKLVKHMMYGVEEQFAHHVYNEESFHLMGQIYVKVLIMFTMWRVSI
jgi:hypothetical protein